MFKLSIDELIPIRRIEHVDPLNGFMSAVIWPAGPCPDLTVGGIVKLTVGKAEYTLAVEDYNVDGQDGWIKLADPAALAHPFDTEVFSGEEGSSFQTIIESRTKVNGPPELARKVPAIVADCSLMELLGDVCSRVENWAWWTGKDGLEIGPVPAQTVEVDGALVAKRKDGNEVRLAELLPRAGSTIKLPNGLTGVVLQARVTWRAGTTPVFTALLGKVPISRRRPPRGTVHWPAKVTSQSPFQVELTDEEQAGRTFVTRARLMARKADKGRFSEEIPVEVDDVFESAVPTGGVSILPVKVYVWSEAQPAKAYRVQAHSLEVIVATKVKTQSDKIDETFKSRISHVSDQWNITSP